MQFLIDKHSDILFINLQYPKSMKGYDSREAFPF